MARFTNVTECINDVVMIATSDPAHVANISSVISVCKFLLDPGSAKMILYPVNWKNSRACFIQPRIFFQFARVDNRDSNISLRSFRSYKYNTNIL